MSRRVLIVGVGSIGERHLRCFGMTGRAELAICEPNAELRATVAQRYNVSRTFSDFDEAIGAGFDAVVICAPAHLHIPMALRAAQAGVHLLIEKPLSVSLDGIEELRAEIARSELVAAVGFTIRAHPALAAMRAEIASGRFGAPVQIVSVCGQNFPFFRPAYRDIYYKDRAQGGGAVQDALTHSINCGEWLVGPIDRLAADCAHQVLEGVEVEDTVHVLTRHGAVLGTFTLNQYQAPNEMTITVVCRQGTARFEYHENRWRWMTEPGGPWHDEPIGLLERDTLFIRQADAFLDTLEQRTPPLCTLEEGEQSLRVSLAILASAAEGGWRSASQVAEASSLSPQRLEAAAT